ncbi:uncharacterized protein LOC108023313 isoform X3 [Drosophila biarmipes]|uniref:uncharacterized protein LOC108023313 isoform X3 n=1 Tax=Drosophila biarmipes TaxID=125945 RepID=UPI0021CC5FB4|nr:uncharacterized protein LOC108023313 isoform X3 [Drosophila biarmipes]
MDHIYLTLLLKLLQLAGRERIARGIIVHIFMLILSFELDLPGTLELTVLVCTSEQPEFRCYRRCWSWFLRVLVEIPREKPNWTLPWRQQARIAMGSPFSKGV